jgi:hypothetical protein
MEHAILIIAIGLLAFTGMDPMMILLGVAFWLAGKFTATLLSRD